MGEGVKVKDITQFKEFSERWDYWILEYGQNPYMYSPPDATLVHDKVSLQSAGTLIYTLKGERANEKKRFLSKGTTGWQQPSSTKSDVVNVSLPFLQMGLGKMVWKNGMAV